MSEPIKSTAAKILVTGDPTEAEARKLAGYVLSDASPERVFVPTQATTPQSNKTDADLKRMLKARDGQPGFKRSVELIRAEIEARKA